MKKRGRVLVLGEDTNAFLATIRSLGRCGLDVHVAWCPLDAASLQSKYVRKIHSVPPYRPEAEDWIESFQTLFRNEEFNLVLPLTDNRILPFQLCRVRFEPLVRLNLLPDDVFRICADKGETYELAVKEGVPVPRQRTVRTANEVLNCAEEFGYPLVLKPRKSATEDAPNVRQAVRKARNAEDLLALTKTMSPDLLVQENFVGSGVGLEVLCRDGEVLTAFQHERVHEPLMGGGSSYRKSVPLHEGMFAATRRLMRALRYSGVAMVEYKQNHATGQWILVEINARFWGSLPLSIAAGIDFPRYLYEMAVENRTEFPTEYRSGIFCRNWTKDMDWFSANLRCDRNDPSLQSRGLWAVLLESANIITLKEKSDTLAFDDLQPAWADLKQYASDKAFRVLKRFQFYRRMEQRRLLRLYRSATSVLIVCHGNICRSPFALAVFERLNTGKRIGAAGVYPKEGRESPEEAIAAAADAGIDLTAHRSRIATPEEIKASDLIIIFERKNWLEIRALCPEVMGKVAYLGAANPDDALELQDPFGHRLKDFQDCYQRIRHLVDRLAHAV